MLSIAGIILYWHSYPQTNFLYTDGSLFPLWQGSVHRLGCILIKGYLSVTSSELKIGVVTHVSALWMAWMIQSLPKATNSCLTCQRPILCGLAWPTPWLTFEKWWLNGRLGSLGAKHLCIHWREERWQDPSGSCLRALPKASTNCEQPWCCGFHTDLYIVCHGCCPTGPNRSCLFA